MCMAFSFLTTRERCNRRTLHNSCIKKLASSINHLLLKEIRHADIRWIVYSVLIKLMCYAATWGEAWGGTFQRSWGLSCSPLWWWPSSAGNFSRPVKNPLPKTDVLRPELCSSLLSRSSSSIARPCLWVPPSQIVSMNPFIFYMNFTVTSLPSLAFFL